MPLKIVTYNIKSGLYHTDGLEAIARVLEAEEPDVVALQEVDRDTRRAHHQDQTAWLARRLGMPYYCFGAATPWDGGGEYGVGLISNLPLLEPKVTHLWVPRGNDVPHGAQEPRVVLSARVRPDESSEEEVKLMVTHLGLTEEQRLRQARQLVEEACDDALPVVLTGDFNGRPDSPEVRAVSAALRDALGALPESERVTFPSGDPEMHGHDYLARTIDYIFVNRRMRLEEAKVIADYSLASDHNPCAATIDLP